jgi:hypothetical protein
MQELLKAVAAKFKPNQLLRTTYEKSPSPSSKRHERQQTDISARQQRVRRVKALKARQEFVQKPFTTVLTNEALPGQARYALR